MQETISSVVRTQVKARRRIMQSPFSCAPFVPPGTVGIIEDFDGCTGDLIVDFGEPFGHVITNIEELSLNG